MVFDQTLTDLTALVVKMPKTLFGQQLFGGKPPSWEKLQIAAFPFSVLSKCYFVPKIPLGIKCMLPILPKGK